MLLKGKWKKTGGRQVACVLSHRTFNPGALLDYIAETLAVHSPCKNFLPVVGCEIPILYVHYFIKHAKKQQQVGNLPKDFATAIVQ